MKMIKQIGFVYVVAALLLAVMLPFFAVYDTSTVSDESASIFGDKILICTNSGLEWVTLADLADKEHNPETPSHVKCPVCFFASYHAGNADMQHSIVVEYHAASVAKLAFVDVHRATSTLVSSAHQTRAPPASSVV
jgi:hypothetical protein